MYRLWFLFALSLLPLSSLPMQAHEFTYTALLSGAAQSPPNASPAFGIATITLDLDLVTMRVEVSFSDLTGTVTTANLHAPTVVPGTGTTGIASQVPTFPGFPVGVSSGSFDQTFDLTVASSYNPAFIAASGGTVSDALNALIFALDEGRTYLNINSTSFPEGEIRGFLVAVPEPGTLALITLGGGTGLLAFRYQWKRRQQV